MAKKLSQKKLDRMFAAYCDRQSVRYVARKCNVSPTTVIKYRNIENWDGRLPEIQADAAQQVDALLTERRANDLRIVQAAKKVYASGLTGKIKAECPNCSNKFDVTVPKMKASLRDIDVLVRLGEFLAGESDMTPELAELRRMSTPKLLKLLKDLEK